PLGFSAVIPVRTGSDEKLIASRTDAIALRNIPIAKAIRNPAISDATQSNGEGIRSRRRKYQYAALQIAPVTRPVRQLRLNSVMLARGATHRASRSTVR